MNGIRRSAAAAAVTAMTCLFSPLAAQEYSAQEYPAKVWPPGLQETQSDEATGQDLALAAAASRAGVKVSSGGVVQGGPAGTVQKQIPSVSTSCLRPQLVGLLRRASSHFGSAAIVTSGYRPGRRSYHGKCMAADVQIAGVSPGTLARYFRAQPDVGGVGTYRHTHSVHVDVAERKFSWNRGGRRSRLASAN